MNPLSLKSGLSESCVAKLSTCWTSPWVCWGRLRNSLTTAVSNCSWTWAFSSAKPKLDEKNALKSIGDWNRQLTFEETIQEFISIVNSFRVLANNPYHRGSGLRFIQSVEIFAQSADDTFILVRILSEIFPREKPVLKIKQKMKNWKKIFV